MATSPWTRLWAVRDPARAASRRRGPARGASARSLGARSVPEDKPALSGLPWGRIVSAPVLAERGRRQIPSVSETNQLEDGLEPDVSVTEAADLAVLFSTRERPARPGGHEPARRSRIGPARRSRTGPAVTNRPGPAPPISTTRVGSRRCAFGETAARRARSGSTGLVRRAHGASHRGCR